MESSASESSGSPAPPGVDSFHITPTGWSPPSPKAKSSPGGRCRCPTEEQASHNNRAMNQDRAGERYALDGRGNSENADAGLFLFHRHMAIFRRRLRQRVFFRRFSGPNPFEFLGHLSIRIKNIGRLNFVRRADRFRVDHDKKFRHGANNLALLVSGRCCPTKLFFAAECNHPLVRGCLTNVPLPHTHQRPPIAMVSAETGNAGRADAAASTTLPFARGGF